MMDDKEDSFSCDEVDTQNSEIDTVNSELYNLLTEHFPVLLPNGDNTDDWRPAVSELTAKLPCLVKENEL
jgi:hypothetical protein